MSDTQKKQKLSSSNESESLFNDLRRLIEKGHFREGDRLEPLRTLAKNYNTTVRSARSALERLQQLELITLRQGSGAYVCAPPISKAAEQTTAAPILINKQRNRMRVIMLMDHQNEVWGQVSQQLVNLMIPRGLEPLPLTCVGVDRNQTSIELANCIQEWQDDPPYAIIVQTQIHQHLIEQIENACKNRSHMIMVGLTRPSWHTVRAEHAMMSEKMVEVLIGRGCKSIGLITHGRVVDDNHPENLSKATAYHTPLILALGRAIRKAGLQKAFRLHYNRAAPLDHEDCPGSSQPGTLYNRTRLTQWLERENRPDAIVGDDFRIAALIRVAHEIGMRVGPGKDIDIIGIGNTEWSRVLHFDSMDYQPHKYAEHIFEILQGPIPPFGPRHEFRVPPLHISRADGPILC